MSVLRKAPAAAAYTHYVTIMDTVPPLVREKGDTGMRDLISNI